MNTAPGACHLCKPSFWRTPFSLWHFMFVITKIILRLVILKKVVLLFVILYLSFQRSFYSWSFWRKLFYCLSFYTCHFNECHFTNRHFKNVVSLLVILLNAFLPKDMLHSVILKIVFSYHFGEFRFSNDNLAKCQHAECLLSQS